MALVDLTNVNPYAGQVEAQRRLDETNAQVWSNLTNKISQGIQAGIARRQELDNETREQRDREFKLANESTSKLVQANTGTKYTDVQLQQVGRQFKQEYYDAVKTYENSDKGDEARDAFEEAKQASLGSARTIGASIDALSTSMDAFKEQAKVNGISNAMDPAIRAFFADLNDPATRPEQYQIVKDDQGRLKYQGTTSPTESNPKGYPVDFFLEDLANGENEFAPQGKEDMPSVIQTLTKGLDAAVKQEKREHGVVEVTDWNSVDQALTSRINELFDDDTNFRQMAAGLGYGYNQVETVIAGEPLMVDPDGDGPGQPYEVKDIEGLKDAMAQELKMQVESTTAHKEKWIAGADPDSQVQAYNQEQTAARNSAIVSTISSGDPGVLNAQLTGKKVSLDGVQANFREAAYDDKGNLVITGVVGTGKNAALAEKVYDMADPNAAAQAYILLGMDPGQAIVLARANAQLN